MHVYMPYFLYVFIHGKIPRLIPHFGYCKKKKAGAINMGVQITETDSLLFRYIISRGTAGPYCCSISRPMRNPSFS